jgi:DNA-binding winged helix-turn-helix (wHTH) protein/Tfp pilus assembly protein PilF
MTQPVPAYEFGPYRLEPSERRLLCQGQAVPLTPKALDLLIVLVGHAGHLANKEALLKAVWEESFVEEANLAYTVSALRKALGDAGEPHQYIETVAKRGYRFTADVRRIGAAVQPATRRRFGVRVLAPAAAGVVLIAALVSASLMRRGPVVDSAEPAQPLRAAGPAPSTNRDANDYFARAILFLTVQHDLTRCREMLQKALEYDPKFTEAKAFYAFTHVLMIIGGSSNDSSWLFRAEEEAHGVVADEPKSVQGHVTLGSVYLLTGRKDLSANALSRALELQPHSTEVRMWQGNLQLMNGNFAGARSLYQGVLAQNPLIWPARGLLGLALSFDGQLDAAARELGGVLEQDPNNIEALAHLATVEWQRSDLAAARAAIDRALKVQPSNYRTRLLHGVQLALEGQRDRALREVDSSVERYAHVNVFVALQMAQFNAALNDADKTLEWLEHAGRSGLDHDESIRRDRLFASLRPHSRFRQIVDSMESRRRVRLEWTSTR